MSERSTLEPRAFDAGRAAFGGTLDVDTVTGSASLQLPLRTTAGRQGFGPSLGLGYRGGAGNSVFGVGWTLGGVESIGRDLAWRLPRYVDGEDRLQLGGAEIVPMTAGHGPGDGPVTWRSGDFVVERWRARVERRFERIERWTDDASGAVHWRTIAGDGTVSIYGRADDGSTRIADPDDPSRVAHWLIESRHHPRGDAIRFEYRAENLDGVDPAAPEEFRRLGAAGHAMRHPKRVRYGATRPWGADEAPPADLVWRFEVVFDYGEHADVDGLPQFAESAPWTARADAFSTYRAGFEMRTRRLCRRVLMFHRFDALGAEPVAVGATELTHEARDEGAVLVAARYRGYRPAVDGADQVATRATPAASMTYAVAELGDGFLPGPSVADGGLTASVHRRRHLFIDLFGEGVPGLLVRDGDAWLWRENLGDGRFAPAKMLDQVPQVAALAFELQDLDGDGRAELGTLVGRQAGAFRYDPAEGHWGGLETLTHQPRLDFGNAAVQITDLDGDGHPDLIVDGHDHFLWYPSEGADGFAPARRLDKPQLDDGGTVALDGDIASGFLFADMTGDGLADLVRVSTGRVEYWPHLGHGRFAPPVVMGSPPSLPGGAALDRRRVRLADLTGNGLADLLYLGDGTIHVWYNLAGNRFADERQLLGLPRIDSVSTVEVHDLLGHGLPCLVWMNPTAHGESPIQYLPIHGEVRPGLLTHFETGLGLTHEIDWRWSGRDYLDAKSSPRPWSTQTPRHRSVVRALRGVDALTGQRRANLYAFRDGAFDADDRSFVGFGEVEIHNRELGGEEQAPPSLVRLWNHLGVVQPPTLDAAWTGDPGAVEPPLLTRADETTLTNDEYLDAARAIAGLTLRREVYACSVEGVPAEDPLFVTVSGFEVRRLQPGRDAVTRAAFAPRDRERLSSTYESTPEDPRVSHEIELDPGPYGAPAITASIHYARRPVPERIAAQTLARGSAERRRHAHLDVGDDFAPNVVLDTEGFEISGLGSRSAPFAYDEAAQRVRDAVGAAADFGQPPPAGVGARRVTWRRWSFWNRDRTAVADPAATGVAGLASPLLLHHLSAAVAPRATFDAVYPPLGPSAGLIDEAGLVEADGHLWADGPVTVYGDRASFHRVAEEVAPTGVTSRFTYQHDHLAVASVHHAVTGDTVTGRLDPLSCAFDRIVDQNGAVTETLYDALGTPVRTALHGDQEGTDGDIHRWGADDLVPAADPHGGVDVASALADPAAALGGASAAVFHDLDAFVDAGRPPRILRLLRDDPVHDGEGGTHAASALRVELEYLDGLGRTLQRKLKVDPGPAIARDAGGEVIVGPDGRPSEVESAERWATSGFVHYAASGDVLASFERFFTPSSAYEDDDALRSNGVSQRLHYDALGRVVRVDYPDDSVARSVHEAWRELSYDRNDAIVGTDYETARATLPLDDPERIALEQARAHADTPHETWLDVRGRVAVGIEHGEAGSRLETRHEGDPGAGETRLIDARGLVCVERRLDMLGRPMWQRSQDAGETWTLLGWDSRPRRIRDARGVVLRHTYDAAGRAITLHADVPGDGERLVERVVFGDDPSVVDAARRNLRGTRVRVFDDAGVEEVLRRSPFGARLAETRRFRDEHRQTVDWTDPATVALEADTWTTEQRLDALGRPWRRILADGTRVDQTFGRLGETTRVEVTTADGTLDAQPVLLDADYDVHGRRRSSTLGNGVTIEHDYRSDDQRLAAVRAIDDGGRRLQDLRYTYDPEGNLVVLDDASQAPGAGGAALAGLAVTAEKHYRHDAHYRLIEATGRAHRALLIGDHASGFGTGPAFKSTRHITLANGVEVERYRRTYAYDAGGNLTRIRHLGTTANWTRDLWVSATSNRSLPALDDGGLPVVDPEASFDAAGQLVRLSHLRTMDWNWRGRLVRSVLIDRGGPGDDDAEYNVYGSAGPRVRRVVERRVDGAMEHADTRFLPGCTIRRVHRVATGNDILVRTTAHVQAAGQALVRLHQWQVDTFGREVDDLAEKRLRYPLADHVGSATLELDADGRVTTAEEFFPFGGTAFIAGDRREVAIKENRFTGALRDDATGFYCFDFRHYAPWIGNWISPDPAGLVDGLNLYRYARNNPVRFVDPTGLDSTISVPGMPQEVRTAITTPGEDARGIVRNYAQNVTVTGADGRTYGFRSVRVVARNGANGGFQRWWVQFRDPYAIEPTVTYDFDDEPLAVTASDDDESDPSATTPGAGAGDRGNGPGAGERGDGDGGGGKNDTTTGPGDGDGAGPGTGDGTADEAPINPGDGTDDAGKDDEGDEGGDDERDRPGVENGSRDPSTLPLLEEDEERKEEKDREADRDPDDRRSGGETRDGSRTDPPPGLPTGEDGVPWSPELDITPLDEIPEGAEFTTDPSKVQRDGRGTADGRGTPGDSESPSARPGGVEGGSSSGSAEATGNDQGARGAGAGGGSGAGDPRNTTGQRGLQGGMGSHELPSWLSWIDPALDGLQIGLDVIGLIPGLGEIADGINGVISLARGDYLGASLSFAAMIPFAGWAATAGKFGRRAVRATDAASDVGGALLRHGDEAVDVGRQAGRRTPGGTRPETPAEVYNSAAETPDMVVQQLEHSCGAACARQLLADEGIDVSESLLRRTGFDPNPGKTQGMYPGGVAENLNRVATERGLGMEFVGKFDPDFLPGGNHMADPEAFVRAAFEGTGGQPFIARQGGHFVIADRFADGMVHLRDPSGLNWPSSATGIRATIDAKRFVAAFGNGHFGMVWKR